MYSAAHRRSFTEEDVRFNTYTKQLAAELITTFDHFDKDDTVRVVVLTADPKAPVFSAGVSLREEILFLTCFRWSSKF